MNPKHTISVHAGKREGSQAVVNAIEPSSAFRYLDCGDQPYPRYFNTPNQEIIVDQICALECADAGMVFASGMAAISTTLLSLAERGEHVVFQNALYGGTHSLVMKEFKKFGIEFTLAACNVDSLIAATRPNTKLIYVESPSNPKMEIVDLTKLASEARALGITTIVDNTFATPINQNPINLGINVVVHSGTKYLGGHSDLSFGAVVGKAELVEQIREKAVLLGGNVNGFTCYLIERSIKTLAIRVSQQNQNAMRLAQYLNEHPAVNRVFYPGLGCHPNHDIAAKQMSGFGGMLSFELAETLSPKELLQHFSLITPAMSLGGVESTVTIPAYTSHKPMPVEDRLKLGITEQLVRMSVGIESADDLILDFENAFASMNKKLSGVQPVSKSVTA